MSKRQPLKVLVALVVIGGVIAAAIFIKPPERNLLKRATCVAATPGWYTSGYMQDTPFQWMDDHTLFVWRSLPRGVGFEAVERDTKTGVETPLTAFNRSFPRKGHPPAFWLLSPDNKWLLWLDASVPKTWYAIALDGSRVVKWSHPQRFVNWNAQLAAWTPDSRRVVEVAERRDGDHAYVYSLDAPQTARDVRVTAPQGLALSMLQGMANQHRAVVSATDMMHPDVQPFCEFNVNTTSATLKRLPSQRVAGNDSVYWVSLSPQGDQVTWTTMPRAKGFAMRDALRRFFPFIKESPPQTEIWVSRVDSDTAHSVGTIPSDPNAGSDALNYLCWTPGGKRVSFTYKRALYAVPAN